jgi:hypothetical protein
VGADLGEEGCPRPPDFSAHGFEGRDPDWVLELGSPAIEPHSLAETSAINGDIRWIALFHADPPSRSGPAVTVKRESADDDGCDHPAELVDDLRRFLADKHERSPTPSTSPTRDCRAS